MKALFKCEKNWQKIKRTKIFCQFSFLKSGKCRSITYSGDFATLPHFIYRFFMESPNAVSAIRGFSVVKMQVIEGKHLQSGGGSKRRCIYIAESIFKVATEAKEDAST